jgi:hypothetical protein
MWAYYYKRASMNVSYEHCRISYFTATYSHHTCNKKYQKVLEDVRINPLKAKLYPIFHFLALLGAHPILHVSTIRVKYHMLV